MKPQPLTARKNTSDTENPGGDCTGAAAEPRRTATKPTAIAAAKSGIRIVRPPLQARDAAERFVEWMQLHDFVGDYSANGPNGLKEYYAWHCHEERLTPRGWSKFAVVLASVIPRRRVELEPHAHGGRQIVRHYFIAPLPEVEQVEVIDVKALEIERPRRKRAA